MHLFKLLKLRHIYLRLKKQSQLQKDKICWSGVILLGGLATFSNSKLRQFLDQKSISVSRKTNIALIRSFSGALRISMILLHEGIWLIVKRLGIACSSLVACLPACLSTSSFDSHYGQFIGDLVKPTWQTFTDRKKTAAAAAYTPRCFLQKPRRVLSYRWS